jgi:sugar phosphate isomerase/epimerase
MKYSSVHTFSAAARIVRAAGQPAGCVLVDALHLQRSGGSVTELAGVEPELLPYGQLCDGPLSPVWPPDDQARIESRSGRLLPGDGEFPLAELVAALPADSALSVEAPVAALAGLSPVERARRARAAVSRLLSGESHP